MKKLLLIFAVLFGAGILHAAAPKGWTTDIEAALKTAGSEKKNVLLLFTGSDWCRYCVRLKNDVLDKDDFQKLCNENFVPVYFDFPSNSAPRNPSMDNAPRCRYRKCGRESSVSEVIRLWSSSNRTAAGSERSAVTARLKRI